MKTLNKLLATRPWVAFIDDDQINVPYLLAALMHRLNPGKRDRLAKLTPPHAGTVDAHRGAGPVLAHLLGVLAD